MIVRRLINVLEYSQPKDEDRKSQQVRYLADVLACWVTGVLFEVAQYQEEKLLERCKKREEEMRIDEEEEEEEEDEEEEAEEEDEKKYPDEDDDEDYDWDEDAKRIEEEKKEAEIPEKEITEKEEEVKLETVDEAVDEADKPEEIEREVQIQPEEQETEIQTEPQPQVEAEVEARRIEDTEPTEPELELVLEVETETESEAEAPQEVETETESEAIQETETETEVEPIQEIGTEPESETIQEMETETEVETPKTAEELELEAAKPEENTKPDENAAEVEENAKPEEITKAEEVTEKPEIEEGIKPEEITKPELEIEADTPEAKPEAELEEPIEEAEIIKREKEEELKKEKEAEPKVEEKIEDVPKIKEKEIEVRVSPKKISLEPMEVPKEIDIMKTLEDVFKTDLPYLTFDKIIDTIYKMIESAPENTGEDPITNGIHRAIYEKLSNIVRLENPDLLTEDLKITMNIVCGKIATWLRSLLTQSQLAFMEQYMPEVESLEIRDWTRWLEYISDVAKDWNIWLRSVIEKILEMESEKITRGEWHDWTKSIDTKALLWRRFHLQTLHQANRNRTMLIGRRIVKTGTLSKKRSKALMPDISERLINTTDLRA